MKTYFIPPSTSYLDSVADWLLTQHIEALNQVQIFLPNGNLCQIFTEILINKLDVEKSSYLPSILPLNNLANKTIATCHNGKALRLATKFEQIFTLTKLIHQKQGLSFIESLELADQLLNNFDEILLYANDLKNFSLEDLFDQSLYLQQQLNLLSFYFEQMNQQLLANGKVTLNAFFAQAINQLKLNSPTIIIAPLRQPYCLKTFLQTNASNPNLTVILPPGHEYQNKGKSNTTIKPLIEDKQVLEECLGQISLIEADNEIEESHLIMILIKEFLEQNKEKTIAVVCPNRLLLQLITNNLHKHNIEFADFVGQRLIDNPLCQFILIISKYMLDYDNIHTLWPLLKHPFIFCSNLAKLEGFMRANKFCTQVALLDQWICQQDSELQKWWQQIYRPFQKAQILLSQKTLVSEIFQIALEIAQQIYPQLWLLEHNINVIDLLRDILSSTKLINYTTPQEYVGVLRSLLKNASSKPSSGIKRVNFLTAELALYNKFDLMLIADLNEGSWPNLQLSEIWINNKLRKSLNMPSQDHLLSEKFQEFYLLLCNKKILISRAKKFHGTITNHSRLLQKFLFSLKPEKLNNLNEYSGYLDLLKMQLYYARPRIIHQDFFVNKEAFPATISVTSIELLLRNPYAFFARNILKLYPLKEVDQNAMAAEFGILLHKIICIYNNTDSSEKCFLSIAKAVLQQSGVSLFLYNLWWPKINQIAVEYELFSKNRQDNLAATFSETCGKMILNFAERQINITAIADEILLSKDAKLYIIDYKTGTLPSSKDLYSGLSPQLILEAIILKHGKFEQLPNHYPESIAFIKLASSEPYLQEISFDDIDFDQHLDGLKRLITHYLQENRVYLVLPSRSCAPKYNDYKHLGRKLS